MGNKTCTFAECQQFGQEEKQQWNRIHLTSYNDLSVSVRIFMQSNRIPTINMKVIERLMAYDHQDVLDALRERKEPQQARLLKSLRNVNFQLLDSLHSHLIVKNEMSTLKQVSAPQTLSLEDFDEESLEKQLLLGEGLLMSGKVGICVILENAEHLREFLKTVNQQHCLLLFCEEEWRREVTEIVGETHFVGVKPQLSLIDKSGKICISSVYPYCQILKQSSGTFYLQPSCEEVTNYIEKHKIEYLHFTSQRNYSQEDLVMVALLHHYQLEIVAKCTKDPYEQSPRYQYGRTAQSMHLLHAQEAKEDCPYALENIVIRLKALREVLKTQKINDSLLEGRFGVDKLVCNRYCKGKVEKEVDMFGFTKDLREMVACFKSVVLLEVNEVQRETCGLREMSELSEEQGRLGNKSDCTQPHQDDRQSN